MLSLLMSAALAAPVDIDAGSFQQGDAAQPDTAPVRQVTLGAYRIDRAEVSVGDFARFVAEGWSTEGHWTAAGWRWAQAHPATDRTDLRTAGRDADHPVVAVTWYEADAYCRWSGGSLPTEAQWERASCGADGARYAWGDADDVAAPWYSGGKFGRVSEVSTQTAAQADPALASPVGLVHTAGNVWEWTADWYHREAYADNRAPTDPTGPSTGTWRVLRGGSFMNLPSYCTCTHREPALPDRIALTTGFRCAYPAP